MYYIPRDRWIFLAFYVQCGRQNEIVSYEVYENNKTFPNETVLQRVLKLRLKMMSLFVNTSESEIITCIIMLLNLLMKYSVMSICVLLFFFFLLPKFVWYVYCTVNYIPRDQKD